MDNAIQAVKSGTSFLKASREFRVPKSTLLRRFSKRGLKKHGGQIYMSHEFEIGIVRVLNQLGEWKVPLTLFELRLLVKNYLDLSGDHSKFVDNMPGRDWARSFLKRHGLLLRFASKIKRNRCAVSKEEIESFFTNLTVSLDGVDPSQIYNFDETNFTDDPSRKKCVVRRGVNRHERVTEFSKQAYSVMFCGSATGDFLPPMIVYKAQNMYEGWACDGLKGASYDATPSGWFDMRTFERWFFEIFLPHVKDVGGPKVLIGDNLGSHFSPLVVAACLKHDIRYVTLVPYSTHLCQPLDVAVFRVMKVLWRAILQKWRTESRSTGTIPKEIFPRLLARVFVLLDGKNLVAGFKASGIVPLDSSEVIKRLTGSHSKANDLEGNAMIKVLNAACLTLLSEHIGLGARAKVTHNRGKKVAPVPGQAISIDDVTDEVWECQFAKCKNKKYVKDDNRWIVCDKCDSTFHLQCSGVQYRKRDYDIVDIKNMEFHCDNCK